MSDEKKTIICLFGEKCAKKNDERHAGYIHDAANICTHHLTGECSFGRKCKKLHLKREGECVVYDGKLCWVFPRMKPVVVNKPEPAPEPVPDLVADSAPEVAPEAEAEEKDTRKVKFCCAFGGLCKFLCQADTEEAQKHLKQFAHPCVCLGQLDREKCRYAGCSGLHPVMQKSERKGVAGWSFDHEDTPYFLKKLEKK
jgi:hypothetical protein